MGCDSPIERYPWYSVSMESLLHLSYRQTKLPQSSHLLAASNMSMVVGINMMATDNIAISILSNPGLLYVSGSFRCERVSGSLELVAHVIGQLRHKRGEEVAAQNGEDLMWCHFPALFSRQITRNSHLLVEDLDVSVEISQILQHLIYQITTNAVTPSALAF